MAKSISLFKMMFTNSSSTLFPTMEKEDVATSISACLKKWITLTISSASVTEAAILWVVHKSNFSFDGLPKLSQHMFHDSIIAKIFTMGLSKCAYYAHFVRALYLEDSLMSKEKAALFYITSYAKSLNRIFLEEQMEIYVQYFS